MKKIITLFILLISIFYVNNALSIENISGTWQGELAISPGNELIVQFIFGRNDDASYSAILNTPDQNNIKNIKASSVVLDSGNLKIIVDELSGSYEGIVKDGKIEGKWTQEGTSFQLNLSPYREHVLTKESMGKLLGQWYGELIDSAGTYIIVMRFEVTEKGGFVAFMDSPDEGSFGTQVTDVELRNNSLSFKMPTLMARYKGKYSDNKITGEFKQFAEVNSLILKKGEYNYSQDTLNLPKDIMEQLSGEWYGQLKRPTGSTTLVLKFEMTEKGKLVGFQEMPELKTEKYSITSADLSDDILTLKVKAFQNEFKGKLTDGKLTGEWGQSGSSKKTISLKKGKYIPPIYSLELPQETMKLLSGKWKGKLGPLAIVFRFERTEKDVFAAYLDMPGQSVRGMQFTEASLIDGMLTLKLKAVNGEFKGEILEDSLVGELIRAGIKNPLSVKKVAE